MSQGSLALVLHAHLPFVRHPEHEDFLEEDWLYEAISETYLPLLLVFDRLAEEGVPFRVTMSLTPTLVTMLRDELLMGRYARKLDRLCELGALEVHRTRNDATFGPLARFYREHFESLREAWHGRYRGDLVSAFRRLQDAGHLEIVTCCATHGFLPLMQETPEAVRAQITVAANHYRLTFGRDAPGIWLAECGYYPGVERFLASERIRYFFVDTHGLTDATPRPLYGPFAPIYTEAGVAVYARDPESSQQVWSSESGYPGDPLYREFYRDIGWDLDLDYIRPFIQPTGDRKNTGYKYFRITGKTQEKQPYDPEAARARAIEHAGNFLFNREKQIEYLATRMGGRKPVVVAPYDAELFGHWWFEGPLFLEALIRQVARDQETFRLVSPFDDLREHPENQVSTPPLSSWGSGGYAHMWLDGSNDWIYRHLHHCAQQMVALARDFPETSDLQRRALNQAARELLLAQSSDWAFIMKTGTMVDYAVRRTKEHVLRFLRLHDQVRGGNIDEPWLSQIESRNNIFPEIDYRVYRPA
ncbi:glycoside hydrolase family 57 protein [Hyalangium rubrum]|uniref:1,4-alpha-glucan branching protein domain-containing protein n=1 Tax=Hyalangium rubrum TaxID=3103134 RepID=A0ABU5GVA3_9BACT|nr:1,4-alpha-glucan branching protein domain-containing protein [Hyalangium sp. s54d21]MDY7224799.1 1,4-alpha-glucan branching protein domain-containing protein [Hyalangium sp. s54d21]